MKIEMNKKYKTKNGVDVTILSTSVNCQEPVVGLVHHSNCDSIASWHSDGRYAIDGLDGADLVQVREKKEGWLNIYNVKVLHATKDEADRRAGPDRITCVKVEWEE